MMQTRSARTVLVLLVSALGSMEAGAQVTRYIRFEHDGRVAYGILDGDRVQVLEGSPLEGARATGETLAASSVEPLAPVVPGTVFAVGRNYKSHLGERAAPAYPGIFLKLPTSIVAPEAEIEFPQGAGEVHFEGELVVVIGKTARRVSKQEAADYVLQRPERAELATRRPAVGPRQGV
jgi:2-keto-4-pentenoate hydratase/2-oxohepta-3-ene-1,7-dioic acid hydratase in catechol pathway